MLRRFITKSVIYTIYTSTWIISIIKLWKKKKKQQTINSLLYISYIELKIAPVEQSYCSPVISISLNLLQKLWWTEYFHIRWKMRGECSVWNSIFSSMTATKGNVVWQHSSMLANTEETSSHLLILPSDSKAVYMAQINLNFNDGITSTPI